MLRKFLIVGLLFVLAGVSALVWLTRQESKWQKLRESCKAKYAAGSKDFLQNWLKLPENQYGHSEQQDDGHTVAKTAEQIRQEQYERFVADLDKLGTLEARLYPVARQLYGDDWQQKLSDHNRRREREKTFFAAAVICCCVGVALVLCSLGGMGIAKLNRTKPHTYSQKQSEGAKIERVEKEEQPGENIKSPRPTLAAILNCHKYSNEGTGGPANACDKQPQTKTAGGSNSTKHLFTDRESLEPEGHSRKTHIKLSELLGGKQKKTDSPGYADSTAVEDESFFSSFKSIKQVRSEIDRGAKQFSKDAKVARRISEQRPTLLDETLNKLTEEVAAIRRYAGQQEERVKKFQEGYDWNIIRSFALRMIRCMDNLEKRIEALARKGQATDHLEEVRDELLFALESAGLERYEPQLNSDYHGQEKSAEAVKSKASADKEELKGRIADVVRCGYRFVVDQDNFKVVRAAQVKLFG